MPEPDNSERHNRILDAAADLFIHYGFDKTTVSDIAREAGISKGAIYLHFDSKLALLEALMMREMQVYAEDWLERLDNDPEGGTIAAMYKNSLYAMNSSPFMSAIFKQDSRILGSYLRSPDNRFRNSSHNDRTVFVSMMQEAGAVRTDIDATVIAHIMNIVSYGLVAIDEIMDRTDMPPIEDTIEGIAAIMDRALTPLDGGNPEAGRAIIKQIVAGARVHYDAPERDTSRAEG